MSSNSKFNSVRTWFNRLSHRERLLVSLTFATSFCVFCYLLIMMFVGIGESRKSELARLEQNLSQAKLLANKYAKLSQNASTIRNRYISSSLTFEELTKHIEKLSSTTAKKIKYDIIKTNSKLEVNENLSGYIFNLQLSDLDTKSLLKIIHGLEYGSPPLFLKRVQIEPTKSSGIKALIEIVLFPKEAN